MRVTARCTHSTAWLLLLAGLLGGVLAPAMTGRAWAQARPAPLTLNVPAVLRIPANAEVPVPVSITPVSAVPRQAMVLIRGLPSSIALTGGKFFDSGVWGIKASELPKLRISASSGVGQISQLSISVVSLDGTLLAEGRSNLVVVALDPLAASTQPTVATTSAIPETAPAALTPEDKARIAVLIQKGNEYMEMGSVNVSRSFYSRAADLGSAEAALALAGTFDAALLKQRNLSLTVQADAATAKKWYERAMALGSVEASSHLLRLGGN